MTLRKKVLVYISQWGEDVNGINGGNVKKALSQIEVFQNNGFMVKKVIRKASKYYEKPTILDRIVTKGKNILPFCTNQSIIRYKEAGEADCYYIRFSFYDYYFFRLLQNIRTNNPKSKIVVEYSDYPYLVLKGRDPVGDKLIQMRDQYEKKRCHKYIDRFATFLEEEQIEGKPCLRILNGLDVRSIKKKKYRPIDNELHVMIVASLQEAHGVDRFIEGMKVYYNFDHNVNVFLHVVGGGAITDKLKELAEPLGNKVIFHGFLYGTDLDDIYDQCDIGIEILAPHRKRIKMSASLKSREYIARGIPFISACLLDVSSLGFNEYYRVEDSEKPIDVNKVIQYHRDFIADFDKKTLFMREFAYRYLTMDYAMKEVIDYFNQE